MDDKLTSEIQAYLDEKPAKRDIVHGAEMLFKLNRNRILYQNVLRKPSDFGEKVEYELKKFLQIRLDSKTLNEVVKMEASILPAANDTLESQMDVDKENGAAIYPVITTDEDKKSVAEIAKGKRADHDTLPDEVKSLWNENGELYFRIKTLFEQLKTMYAAPACDRYEYLKQLDELDKTYRENMKIYDEYDPSKPITYPAAVKEANTADTAADAVKAVNAARKFISSNKKKLADLKGKDDAVFADLLAKVQQRVDALVSAGNGIDDAQKEELSALGVTFK